MLQRRLLRLDLPDAGALLTAHGLEGIPILLGGFFDFDHEPAIGPRQRLAGLSQLTIQGRGGGPFVACQEFLLL